MQTLITSRAFGHPLWLLATLIIRLQERSFGSRAFDCFSVIPFLRVAVVLFGARAGLSDSSLVVVNLRYPMGVVGA